MSEKTGKKLIKKRLQKPIEEDFTRRPDGKYNFWQKIPFVEGYSETPHQPVWAIRGVFNRIPKWA